MFSTPARPFISARRASPPAVQRAAQRGAWTPRVLGRAAPAVTGATAVGLADDGLGDPVMADDLSRRLHHLLRHDPEDDGREDTQREPAYRAELGDVPLEVVAGEAEVPRLLGDVDLHDAPEE